MIGSVSAGVRVEESIGALALATATTVAARWSMLRLPLGKKRKRFRRGKRTEREIHYNPNRAQKREWALSHLFEARSRMERALDHARAIDEPRVPRLLEDAIQKCAQAEEIVKKAIAKE